jgi:hypothetical protein
MLEMQMAVLVGGSCQLTVLSHQALLFCLFTFADKDYDEHKKYVVVKKEEPKKEEHKKVVVVKKEEEEKNHREFMSWFLYGTHRAVQLVSALLMSARSARPSAHRGISSTARLPQAQC